MPNHGFPLAAFLFEDREGYCQQFSGAMALMLRMAGIPARVGTGFSPGSLNRDTGEWRVRDLDAHSWVEVNFPEIGWVPFDPTPPVAPAESQSGGAEATSAARGDALEALQGSGAPSPGASSAPAGGGDGGGDGGLSFWLIPLAAAGGGLAWLAAAARVRPPPAAGSRPASAPTSSSASSSARCGASAGRCRPGPRCWGWSAGSRRRPGRGRPVTWPRSARIGSGPAGAGPPHGTDRRAPAQGADPARGPAGPHPRLPGAAAILRAHLADWA